MNLTFNDILSLHNIKIIDTLIIKDNEDEQALLFYGYSKNKRIKMKFSKIIYNNFDIFNNTEKIDNNCPKIIDKSYDYSNLKSWRGKGIDSKSWRGGAIIERREKKCIFLKKFVKYHLSISYLDNIFSKKYFSERYIKINETPLFYSKLISTGHPFIEYYNEIKGKFPSYAIHYIDEINKISDPDKISSSADKKSIKTIEGMQNEIELMRSLDLLYTDSHFIGFVYIIDSMQDIILYKSMLNKNGKDYVCNNFSPYNLVYDIYGYSSEIREVMTIRDLRNKHISILENFKSKFIEFLKHRMKITDINVEIYTYHPIGKIGFFSLKALITTTSATKLYYPHLLKRKNLETIINYLKYDEALLSKLTFTYYIKNNDPLYHIFSKMDTEKKGGSKLSLEDNYSKLVELSTGKDVKDVDYFFHKRDNKYIIKSVSKEDKDVTYLELKPSALLNEDFLKTFEISVSKKKFNNDKYDKKFEINDVLEKKLIIICLIKYLKILF